MMMSGETNEDDEEVKGQTQEIDEVVTEFENEGSGQDKGTERTVNKQDILENSHDSHENGHDTNQLLNDQEAQNDSARN